jgi:uncharacterized protein YabE (DUF348 family)
MINKRKLLYIIICAVVIVLITFYGNVEHTKEPATVMVSPFSSVVIVTAGIVFLGIVILVTKVRGRKNENI